MEEIFNYKLSVFDPGLGFVQITVSIADMAIIAAHMTAKLSMEGCHRLS